MQKKVNQNNNPAWVVKSVKPHDDYRLELLFSDGSHRIFDASEYIKRPMMSPLQSKSLFMRAHIVGPTVGWSDEIDIAPEYLYEKAHLVTQQKQAI